MNTIYEDYLFSKKLDLDIGKQRLNAVSMCSYLQENFDLTPPDPEEATTLTTVNFRQYNYFLYPYDGMLGLLSEIKKFFIEINPDAVSSEWVLQGWLNIYRDGEHIGWHDHGPYGWHGYYCVQVEPNSGTLYRIPPDMEKVITVASEDNLLVLGKCQGDAHRSTEWRHSYPRITIGFDIIRPPAILIREGAMYPNHWIPLIY